MQRYFIDLKISETDVIELNREDNHHLLNVMRAKTASKVHIVGNDNHLFIGIVRDIIDGKAEIEISNQVNGREVELPVNITIACGLSKNDKLDYIVQKGTECGMSSFIPLALERDVVKWPDEKISHRITRLQKISKEAAEQSKRLRVPRMSTLVDLDELLKLAQDYDHCLVAYEETAKAGEKGLLRQVLESIRPGESILFVFGSEGGFTEAEIGKLTRANFKLCSLGPRILRAETAPVYALSAVSYQLEI